MPPLDITNSDQELSIAMVGMDSKDGKLGGKKIKVRVINMPIKQVLTEANAFTSAMGIEPKSA
jgi:hypothetical protein